MAKFEKITKFIAGRRALLIENAPNNWVALDPNYMEIPQDTALCNFCGNDSIRPDQINGTVKIIESHIPSKIRQKVNLYSFGYTSEPIESKTHLLSKEYVEESQKLYKKVFEPILYDQSGNIKSLKGVEEAFSRIILTGHCGGCNVANIIIDGFYNTLLENYSDKQAEILISKIRYFAYAPNEMPNHNVNAFIIAPYIDPSFSWTKALVFAEDQKVDVDYPRGIIKKIEKAKTSGNLASVFETAFAESRAIAFKTGHTVCMIPYQMNMRKSVGDHSIAHISKNTVNTGYNADCYTTKKLATDSASLFIQEFASNKPIDAKNLFSKICDNLENCPPNSQSQPE